LAIRKKKVASQVVLWARRPEAVDAIQRRNWDVQATGSLADAIVDAQMVVLATPVGAMPDLTRQMLPYLRPETLVTDLGSVKASVDAALAPILRGHARWLGGHPMAGGEQTGMDHARADLFEGAVCFLTPTMATADQDREDLAAFWSQIGCRVAVMSPDDHDAAVARISHVPHIAAAALVRAAVTQNRTDVLDLVGPGFRDCTRVAQGSAVMWNEILKENQGAVLDGLVALRGELESCERLLRDGGDLAGWLEEGRRLRSRVKVAGG
jgi:prephenate dehydrogenase